MSTEERSCDTTNKFLQIYPVDTIEKNNTSIKSSYAFSGENDNLLAARKALLNRGKKADNYENFGKEKTQNHGEIWYEETALEEEGFLPTEDKLAKRKENHITDIKGRLKFKVRSRISNFSLKWDRVVKLYGSSTIRCRLCR